MEERHSAEGCRLNRTPGCCSEEQAARGRCAPPRSVTAAVALSFLQLLSVFSDCQSVLTSPRTLSVRLQRRSNRPADGCMRRSGCRGLKLTLSPSVYEAVLLFATENVSVSRTNTSDRNKQLNQPQARLLVSVGNPSSWKNSQTNTNIIRLPPC